jgi:hypothetical protein
MIATVQEGLSESSPDNSARIVPAFVRLGIPVERQAGWEERCAQGSLDSKLDQSPKSFGIS